MLDESRSAAAAAEWLTHAESHLIRAKAPKLEGVLWEHLCFDAQQAAEKALKAVLVLRAVEFPHTHDITELLDLLEEQGEPFPDDFREAAGPLTPYAVESRYPGFERRTGEEECRQAAEVATRVVRWAERLVHGA
jgi:HEPN domain-containing protein